jgi:hypothetical protein
LELRKQCKNSELGKVIDEALVKKPYALATLNFCLSAPSEFRDYIEKFSFEVTSLGKILLKPEFSKFQEAMVNATIKGGKKVNKIIDELTKLTAQV